MDAIKSLAILIRVADCMTSMSARKNVCILLLTNNLMASMMLKWMPIALSAKLVNGEDNGNIVASNPISGKQYCSDECVIAYKKSEGF